MTLLRRAALAAAVLYIAVHFLWFAFDGVRAGWTVDDPMNLHTYWKAGFAKVLLSNFAFWNGFYRPAGGLFYLPLYRAFGLDPWIYHVVMLSVVALNTWLVYLLARALGGGIRMAAFASLFAAVHGAMSDLVYSVSSIYDVLAVFFSLLSLLLYFRARARGPLGVPVAIAALGCLVLAVNSKEIAATLPAYFLLYEVIYHPPALTNLRRWVLGPAAFSFVALAVVSLAMYGKMHGAESMTANEAYRPVFSWATWEEANAAYLGAMVNRFDVTLLGAGLGAIVIAAVTGLVRSRAILWSAGFLLLVTIPISFIPKRLGGSLYLPLTGMAIWAASAVDWVLSQIRWRPVRWVAAAVVAVSFSIWTSASFEHKGAAWREAQAATTSAFSELQRFRFRPAHDQRILFINSPFREGYDLVLMAFVTWNDSTLSIEDANQSFDHGSDWSRFDVVINCRPSEFRIVKP